MIEHIKAIVKLLSLEKTKETIDIGKSNEILDNRSNHAHARQHSKPPKPG